MSKLIIAQVNLTMPAMKVKAEGRVISNFASQHLKSAILFRNKTTEIESENFGKELGSFFEEIRSYASSCIMTAATSLEALINELFIAHKGDLRNKLLQKVERCKPQNN